jgi:hypothetical protein
VGSVLLLSKGKKEKKRNEEGRIEGIRKMVVKKRAIK